MRTTILALILFFTIFTEVRAAADRQAFAGLGAGFQVLSREGSGTGFYFQGHGGYNFDSMIGVGLHAGYSKVGTVNIQVLDYGGFLQLTENNSGVYGRLYLDGVHAVVPGGHLRHGVKGTQNGFSPGVGVGLLIPSVGDFHMVPELGYRLAFLEKAVNLINGTFNLVWDF